MAAFTNFRFQISDFRFQISNGRWPLWSQVRLATQVLRDRPDVLFVPAHVVPFVFAVAPKSRRPKLVTTIHDVVFKKFPETYSARERWYADHATRLAVHHADRIIVPTETVKRDLVTHYHADIKRISVIHHGVASHFVISTGANEVSGVEKSHRTVQRYHDVRSLAGARDDERLILYVGRLERKKNIVRMVEAFTDVAARHPNVHLVLAGSPGYGYEDIRTAIACSPARDRIETLGWITSDRYATLLSGATAFLFPTLGEGFGLPILEAMAAGVPVITSRGGAQEEVAGGAALLVDPLDPCAIADVIARLLSDQRLRDDLVRRGQQRALAFTWNRSAGATWEAIRCVVST